jgi:choline-sulfatase
VRILYIDIDSLRPDHLGCYGYHRNTSPNIDELARTATRFDNYYVSDAPCLPSRTALWSGRCGFRNGVVSHGGTAAEPFTEGPERGECDLFGTSGWMAALKRVGLHTATFSPFGQRHGAWHWYASFDEIRNTGGRGMERADEVGPLAIDWLRRNAACDEWFLHVNLWDPHTPYRTPESFGDPFENDPIPGWITSEVLERARQGFGPHSAQEPHGWGGEDFHLKYPRLPHTLDGLGAVKRWIDGYDVGVRYADEHVGLLLEAWARPGSCRRRP